MNALSALKFNHAKTNCLRAHGLKTVVATLDEKMFPDVKLWHRPVSAILDEGQCGIVLSDIDFFEGNTV